MLTKIVIHAKKSVWPPNRLIAEIRLVHIGEINVYTTKFVAAPSIVSADFPLRFGDVMGKCIAYLICKHNKLIVFGLYRIWLWDFQLLN